MNKRATTDKGSDERVFTHYQPKGKKRSVREYLRSGEPEDTYGPIPQVIEKPKEVAHRPIPEHDRKFIHFQSFLLILDDEGHLKHQQMVNSIAVEVRDVSEQTKNYPKQKMTLLKIGS